jgi:hypothetical protein
MATSLSRPLGATNLSPLHFPPLERQAPASPCYAKLQAPPSPLSRICPSWPPAVQPTRPAHLRTPSVRAFADVSKPEGVSVTQQSKCPFKKLLDRIGLSSNDSDARSQCPFLNQQKMEGESGKDFVGELRAISMAYHSEVRSHCVTLFVSMLASNLDGQWLAYVGWPQGRFNCSLFPRYRCRFSAFICNSMSPSIDPLPMLVTHPSAFPPLSASLKV